MTDRYRFHFSSTFSFSVRRVMFLVLLLLMGVMSLKLAPGVTAAGYAEVFGASIDVSPFYSYAQAARDAHGAHGAHGAQEARDAHGAHGAQEAPDAHGAHGASGAHEAHFVSNGASSRAALLGGTPTVNIVTPAAGVTLNTRDVEVSFGTLDHVVGPIGTNHIHFHLDSDPIPFMMFNGDDPAQFGQQAVLFDFDFTSRATWVNSTTVRFNALTNGEHTLRAHLVDGQHNILANPEATTTITFTVDVPPDDATLPNGLVFVKEQPNPNGMGRVFDNDPDIVGDLYLLSPVTTTGTLTQLTDVAKNGGGVSDPEVSWDGQRVLFAMKQDADDTWHIYEMNADGTGFRQVTSDPAYQNVNDMDPDYLPDGRIVFASDRLKQRDEYNVTLSTQLYTANADGSNINSVEPNPSHDSNPQVIRDGRIVFNRWDHLAHRNIFTNWHMNQDGSSGFVFFGGASPRGSDRLNDAQGIEQRQLEDGQMVGIFTHRSDLAGVMAAYDNRNGDLEDLPKPIVFGPQGLYRTPHPLTTQELIYSYSTGDDITDDTQAQFGLYTMPWTPEEVLVDDNTVETAPGPGTNLTFRFYTINLDAPSRVYVEVTGSADDNGDGDDDDLWVIIAGTEYRNKLERRLDGDLIQGLADTFRVDADLDAGQHLIQIATNQTPTLDRVRIVRAIAGSTPTLLYDDPNSNEVSPIPVRARTLPPIYPSKVNFDLSWGTFLVRDVSLRGDFRQPNHNSPEGDPNFNFHLDLSKLRGLRVVQSVPRRANNKDLLIGASGFDPVRVLGVAPPNEFGTTVFQAPANNTTAWDLIGHQGEGIVHERVWSLVQPGEVRACGGCHVPQLPFTQREIGPIPAPTDLRTRGRVYSFVDDMLPILQENCVSCHTEASPAGGLSLLGDRANYDALHERVDGRTPREYINDGDTRTSFLFQLLTADARGNETHQTRIDAINANTDHTSLLTSDELYDLATVIDTGSGFAYLPDGTASGGPRVIGVSPPAGSTNVAQNTGVAIHFDAPIDRATVDASTFTVQQVGGGDVAGSWEWGDDSHVLFRPTNALSSGEYEVSLSGNIVDIKRNSHSEEPGEALAAAFSSRFTVGSSSDNAAPQVAQLLPSGSASPIGPVVIRFNEPIDPGSVNELTLWVVASNGAWVEGRVGVSADGMEAAFAPRLPFEAGASYTLHIGGDPSTLRQAQGIASSGHRIRDLAGNPLSTTRQQVALTSPPSIPPNSEGEGEGTLSEGYKLFIGDAFEDQPRAASPSETTHSFTISNTPATQHHTLIAERETGNGAEHVAVNSDGTRVLVANQGSDSVTLYDGTTWDVINTFGDVGDDPFDVAFSSDSKQGYVLNTRSDDVRIVRLLDGTTLATVSGMVNPTLMTLNHAGTRLYVTDQGDPDALHEIDVDVSSGTFGQILRTMTLNRQPYDVALSPDDKLLYFTASRALTVIDMGLWLEKEVIDLPNWSIGEMALSPDGRQAVVSNPNHDVLSVLDLTTGQHIVQFPVDESPQSVVYSPDGRFIYVSERDNRTIAIIDVSTLQVVRRVPLSGVRPAEGMAMAPDGRMIYVVEDGSPGKLRVFHLADLSDTTAPQVSQVTPANNDSSFPIHAPIRIDLSEEVDRLTANDQTIQLEYNGATLGADIRVSDDNRTIWLWPRATLQSNTIYTLRITTDVKDLANNALAAERVINFSTANQAASPPLSLWATPDGGDNPRGAAVTPDGALALTTDYWGNRLYLIDTSTWQSTSLDLGGRVSHVAVRPDGSLAYVLRPENDMVMVVDLGSRSVIDMDPALDGLQGIAVGDNPQSLLYHPTQARLYVVNYSSEDLSVIDTNTHQESGRWAINNSNPRGVAISPDAQHLYVTSRNRLSVLHADTGQEVKAFTGMPGSAQYGVVVTDNGNQVWFASESTDELVAIDLRLDQVVTRLPVGDSPTWLALSPDGETIYVNNQQEGSVSLVQWRTSAILNTIHYPGELFALAVNPAAPNQLYVASSLANGLLVYRYANPADESGPQTTTVTPSDGSQNVAVIAPLVVQFNEAVDRASVNVSTLRVVDGASAARTPEELTEAAINGQYVFSTDNRTVTFVPDHPWHPNSSYTIYQEGGITDAAGNPLTTEQRTTFKTAATLDPVTISPREEHFGADEAWGMALSPDGTQLAVSNRYWDNVTIIDPANLTTLHTISVGDEPMGIAFNSDGSRLYVVHRADDSLLEIDMSTRQTLRTFSGLSDGEELAISPDGTKAYVTGYYSGGVDEINLTSGEVMTQTQVMDRPGKPAYAPDGTLYVPAVDELWRYNGSWSRLQIGYRYNLDIAFSADGRHAYISEPWNDKLRVVDLELWDSAHVYDLNVGDEPRKMTQSADKRLLVIGHARDGTIQVIDTLTQRTVQSGQIPGGWLSHLLWDETRARLFVGEAHENKLHTFDLSYTPQNNTPTVLAVDPSSSGTITGQPFSVTLKVQTVNPVDAAAAYLNFDPSVLQVLSITLGSSLSNVTTNQFDNTSGQIDLVAASPSALSSDFIVATVTFNSLSTSDGTLLTFNSSAPRQSDLSRNGSSVLEQTQGGTVVVADNTSLVGAVTLEGRPTAPNARWSVPLTVHLYETGTQNEVASFTPTTDQEGQFTLTDLQAGTYDVYVKNAHTLQKARQVTIVAGQNNLDIGTLLEGDANNDNYISLADFSILAGTFGTCQGDSGYDDRSDFDEDNCVTMPDFSLLSANFGQAGESPQPSRGATSPSSLGQNAPTGDVKIVAQPTTNHPSAGERFTVAIQIEAGTQQVDGGAAYLNFDPDLLRVTQITQGEALPFALQSSFNNEAGQLNIAAGAFNDYPTGAFDLAYVEFEVLQEGIASLDFQFNQKARHTYVTFRGHTLLSDHQNAPLNGYQLYLPTVTR